MGNDNVLIRDDTPPEGEIFCKSCKDLGEIFDYKATNLETGEVIYYYTPCRGEAHAGK